MRPTTFVDILGRESKRLADHRADFLSSFSESDLNYLVDRWAMKERFCQAGDMKWGIYLGTRARLTRAERDLPRRLATFVCACEGMTLVPAANDRRRPGPGPLRLPARARPVAGELLVVRRRILVHLDPHRRLPDVLPGLRRGGPAFFWTWPVVFLGQFTVALGFAELAAHYPLSGGVYQWSRRIGWPGLGWMAGWVYLACSVISLASVALALQATLPQIITGLPGDRRWRQSRPIAPGTPSSWAAC